MIGNACRRFARLKREADVRQLSAWEQTFLLRHSEACPRCTAAFAEEASALEMLRASALEVEDDPVFSHRVLREARIQQGRDTWRYWSPALIAASLTCLAFLAGLQLLTARPVARQPQIERNEARLEDTTDARTDLVFPRDFRLER